MIKKLHALLLLLPGGLAVTDLVAQCPTITCPANITVNAGASACAANVSYTAPVGTNPCGGTQTVTFAFTGGQQNFTVPTGVTSITVDAQGAQGGGTAGGNGGRAIATIPVTPGEVLQVWVGGTPIAQTGAGGFNGGGAKPVEPCGSGSSYSFCGGGGTDLRRGSGYANRIIVAGGGGGQGWSNGLGGSGGGTTGTDGAASWIAGTHGRAGTPSAGGVPGFYSGNGQSATAGTFGVGGEGRPVDTYCSGGGGGGGWYGGGGGYVSAGGGGSSYVSFPGNTATSTTAGFRAGNGQLIITYNGSGPASTALTSGPASGASFPVGTTPVVYTVTAGVASANCSFNVTVVDNQAPSISCPANITVSAPPTACGANVSYSTPVGTDNCSGVSTTRTAGLASGSLFPIGTTTVTHAATDAASLSTNCSFTVTVADVTAPALVCPANIVANAAPTSCSANVNYTIPVGTDNCPGVSTVRTAGLASGALFPIGTTTVTHVATDAASLTSSCSFTVTVIDVTPPVLNCPANVTVNSGPTACGANVTYTAPVGTDNCSGVTTTRTVGLASGSFFPVGSNTVTYSSTDAVSLNTTCTFQVIVNDVTPPVLNCPASITMNAPPTACSLNVSYTTPVGTDNCSGVTTTQTAGLPSGALFPSGSTTVAFSTMDAAGLNTNCSFSVTVVDNFAPIITCPGNVTANAAFGLCEEVVTYTAPTVFDNCPGVTSNMTSGLASGSSFPVGTTTVTFGAADASNNSSNCSFTVTVIDAELPGITCPANITVPTTQGQCGAVVTYTAPMGGDNCATPTTVLSAGLGSGGSFPVGSTVETYTTTDAAGNTNACTFSVTVTDAEFPVLNCPGNQTVASGSGSCFALVNYSAPTASDNCGTPIVAMVTGLGSGASFPQGVTTESYTATDANGNVSTCTFTISVTGAVTSSQTLSICDGDSVAVGGSVYTDAGVYVDTLSALGGCDSIVTTVLSVVTVNSSTSVSGVTISAVLSGASYQWLDCDNGFAVIPGETGQSFTATQSGNYAVAVTSNGCTSTSGCSNVTVVGIADGFGSAFSLYPNPSQGEATVDFGSVMQDLEIRVFDATGKLLFNRTGVSGRTTMVNLSEFSQGVYHVEVRQAQLRKVLRMVVQ